MKKEMSQHFKYIYIYIGYWPVQMNGNKFATGQMLEKPVEVVKRRICSWLSSKVSRTLLGLLHVNLQGVKKEITFYLT
jgi:hypothetical protein